MKSCRRLAGLVFAATLTAGMLFFETPVRSAEVKEIPGTKHVEKELDGSFLSVTGFAKGKVNDRSEYKEGDLAYAVVTNEEEYLLALLAAEAGRVKVIEVRNDLYLGWWEISEHTKEVCADVITAYGSYGDSSLTIAGAPVANPILIESGISTISVDNIKGLTIFSKTGNSIYHSMMKVASKCNDIVIRNLSFAQAWEFEDWRDSGYGTTGGHGKCTRVGWANIKINGAKNIWIDHCSFGISFDGNVDIENGASEISITWCKFMDHDYSKGSMLYRTSKYFEDIYQESKTNDEVDSFKMYEIMRDNGMSEEDVMKYMDCHVDTHMVGAGEKDSWLYRDHAGNLLKDETKTDANENIRVTFAYDYHDNMLTRIPLLRSGVGHLYNCYCTDETVCYTRKFIFNELADGSTIRQKIEAIGGNTHVLARALDARSGATIGVDTNVYVDVDSPMIMSEHSDDDFGPDSKFYQFWTYNHALIVNSSTKKDGSKEVYYGSSWDNSGDNPFTTEMLWHDKYTIHNWSWGQEGERLSYEYQTFPLNKVEEYTRKYGGVSAICMTGSEWLQTEYDASFEIQKADSDTIIPLTNIILNKASATIYSGEYLQLYERLYPQNTTETAANLNWRSSNEEIASVNDCGLVKPRKTGNTVITASNVSGVSAACEITVENLPSEIELEDFDNQIYTGDIVELRAKAGPDSASNKKVTWVSQGRRITILNEEKGILRADSAGTNPMVVYAVAKGNRIGDVSVNKEIKLTITDPKVPVTGIAFPSATVIISPKEKKPLLAAVIPENATNQKITYYVSDSSIALVDETGNLTGIAPGTTTVHAVSVNYGFEAVMNVTVAEEKKQIKGDIDGNTKVNLLDAQAALKGALGIKKLSAEQISLADINKNGGIDLSDAQMILKAALQIVIL